VKEQNVTCKSCKGSRFCAKEKMGPCCDRAAAAIADLVPACEGYDDVLKCLIGSSARVSALGALRFSERINECAREKLNSRRLQRGQAIMFVGKIARNASLTDWEKDMAVASIDGAGSTFKILAVAPDDAGRLDPKQSAIIVGVVTGMVSARRGEDWIVLDRVMAVPLAAEAR